MTVFLPITAGGNTLFISRADYNAPVISGSPTTTGEVDAEWTYSPSASDADTYDVLTWSLTSYPTGMTINASTGAMAWTPTSGQVGSNSVSILVTDRYGLTDTQDFTITVSGGEGESEYTESLDEMFLRKDRKATATWAAAYLEDTGNYYTWQPETFCYNDVTTGTEVWKMTHTPSLASYYHNDIGVPVWSADGKRLALQSSRTTQYSATHPNIWMTCHTTGGYFRHAYESACRAYGSVRSYFEWDPQVRDQCYEIGYNVGTQKDVYRTTVGDTSVSPSLILTLPENVIISKMVSSDGQRLMLQNAADVWTYPCTVISGSEAIDDADGYSVDRSYGLYGGMTEEVGAYHDTYILGLGDWSFVVLSDTGGTWWRIKNDGSDTDGGPLYTGDLGGNDFGEAWPESYIAVSAGNLTSPFTTGNASYDSGKVTYMSHACPDRWGRCIAFSNVADGLPGGGGYYHTIGPAVWDVVNHAWELVSSFDGCQHHDWHGFTDWFVSSGRIDTGYPYQPLRACKYNDAETNIVVCYPHCAYDGGSDYYTYIRPAQSPDGTKAAFHSEFLNGINAPDCFWAVVYYPAPPTDLDAAQGAGTSVDIEFLPPTYTSRKWINRATGAIDEDAGETLYAREVKRYHLWRSANGTSGWARVGTANATYTNHATTNTLIPTYDSSEVTAENPILINDDPGDGTFYYAVTTEEHSGLESRELSEILEVVIASGSLSTATVTAVQGQEDFYTTAPSQPTGFSATDQAADGHSLLEWTEPEDDDIRYYNLYYRIGSSPTVSQRWRFASVPVGHASYLDWLADTDVTGTYGITSVDRLGNESDIVLES